MTAMFWAVRLLVSVIKNAPQPSFVPVIETVRDRVVVVRQVAILWGGAGMVGLRTLSVHAYVKDSPLRQSQSLHDQNRFRQGTGYEIEEVPIVSRWVRLSVVGKRGVILLCILFLILLLSRCYVHRFTAAEIAQINLSPNMHPNLSEEEFIKYRMELLAKIVEKNIIEMRNRAIEKEVESWGTGLYFVDMGDGKYVFANFGRNIILKFKYR